ncbi:agamous-like MADS-box protein AGL29 [Medicago truncatula]|uniref:MADS-box transcription factor family protein n=2 Tax=Medicago truncatula TaxID=3880 RepID=G7IQD2_MEDTR|nr:agamous-like MADS-box protein AGL29 [Medicago truncatula]AES65653.1 MADS-box transcription factor family protein [Medicago truncatula]
MNKNCELSEERKNAGTKLNNTRKRKMHEIKKLDEKERRLGIFNKAIELSILCQSKTAIIVKSPNKNKFYACGYPCDSVIQRFLTGRMMVEDGKKKKEDDDIAKTLRLQYEALQEKLEEEEDNLKSLKVTESQKSDFNVHDWWNNSIDDMDLASLEDFKNSLDSFKNNLRAASQAEKSNLHPNLNIAT